MALGQREQSEVDIATTDSHCQAPRANSPESVHNLLNICCVLCQAEQLSVLCDAAYWNSCSHWKQHDLCFLKAKQIIAKDVHLGPPTNLTPCLEKYVIVIADLLHYNLINSYLYRIELRHQPKVYS